ncbi:hypothetical protein GCK32_019747 [Trichostrongylus colubriformis]|uniref:Alpha/beta hydrolase fold-3 domain-containing protein n=1 Tax=Trichostrongylus colubriformis TaxID=6319 RepID=A0AAN8FJE7_TRICO
MFLSMTQLGAAVQCIAIVLGCRRVSEGCTYSMVTKESIGGVEVGVYTPHKRQSKGALVFFHGGGWVSARPEAYDTLIAALVRHVWVTVISVDHRLAPEYPFPVPVNDCEAVVKDLYKNRCVFNPLVSMSVRKTRVIVTV